MSKVIHSNDKDFGKDVLKSDIPVLLDFWAPWCGPCRMLSPVLDAVSTLPEIDGKVKIVKINVDENPIVSNSAGVRSIPYLLLFKDGEVIAQQTGMMSQSQLLTFVQKAL